MDRRIEERRKNYKKAVDAVEARRKREDLNVQLRKQKREENLMKKRQLASDSACGGSLTDNDPGCSGNSVNRTAPQTSNIPEMVQGVFSGNRQLQLQATQAFRKLLSIEQNPPIQEVVDANVVPAFVEFLKDFGTAPLQFEAAWALTNVASGTPEQTRVVIEAGSIPIFVQLLSSPNDDVREQAVWALGNIAGDSPKCRDFVLQAGGLAPLLNQLRESEKFSMLRNATWTLSNLCRGKPQPPFEWVSPALSTLANLIYSTDYEVLTDSCWALSYLSDGPNERIDAVIQSGVCRRLVDLLLHTSPLVQTPALRTVGNIVTGDDRQTQVILQCQAIPNLLSLLSNPKKGIKKEACWTISNITAGNREQIQEVIEKGLITPLVQILSTAEFDIRKEAAWAISNATSGGSPQQVEYLVTCGCIPPLCDLLEVNDTKIVSVALEALENILRTGKQKQTEQNLAQNPYCALIESTDGLTKIEALQEDQNEDVYQKSAKILGNYFPLEDDEDVGETSGARMDNANLRFGANAPHDGFNFGQ